MWKTCTISGLLSNIKKSTVGAVSRVFALGCCAFVFSCTSTIAPGDSGLEGLELNSVNPQIIVPGTVIVVQGHSFVGPEWGVTQVIFSGELNQTPLEVRSPARYLSFQRLEVDVDTAYWDALAGGEGIFVGTVTVSVESLVDRKVYRTQPLPVSLDFQRVLKPTLGRFQIDGLLFVNDAILVEGSGFLLGGGEGQTYARVDGCFRAKGEFACRDVDEVLVPIVPSSPFDRTRGTFAFLPDIVGVSPGTFEGEVTLKNQFQSGVSYFSQTTAVEYDLIETSVFSMTPTAASLGQYVYISGGGFVGGTSDSTTLLKLVGTYSPSDSGSFPVFFVLVPEFVHGRLIRYVINEDDSLGQALDLRKDTGTFTGKVTPIVRFRGMEVEGDDFSTSFSIAPVKQVVRLNFSDSYVESLRLFGLRAVDAHIRERILAGVRRDYGGVNLEVRLEEPEDFAYFSNVDIVGPDPNGLGLFGYDNSPGKDTNNLRLYDRIGGVNAETQDDGYPGFGGVFIESLFGFSQHPGSLATELPGASALFDQIFDPFRPDRGGTRVRSVDLSTNITILSSGNECPASERSEQISCAIWVLGALVGSTVSHEIGHSLGLANPFGEGFHNPGDYPSRLMDSGGDRPFAERAEIGVEAARFCDEEYLYLQDILPSPGSGDNDYRPPCY